MSRGCRARKMSWSNWESGTKGGTRGTLCLSWKHPLVSQALDRIDWVQLELRSHRRLPTSFELVYARFVFNRFLSEMVLFGFNEFAFYGFICPSIKCILYTQMLCKMYTLFGLYQVLWGQGKSSAILLAKKRYAPGHARPYLSPCRSGCLRSTWNPQCASHVKSKEPNSYQFKEKSIPYEYIIV